MRTALHLVWPWRFCASVWRRPHGKGRKMHTAWCALGPLALCLRMPRWEGDRR